jgi:hypothetical protein
MSENLLNFINNYRKYHNNDINDDSVHFNNIYHVVAKNRDGDITDEKFGVNTLTNRGLSLYKDSWDYNGSHYMTLEIGSGTSAIDPSNYNLEAFVAVSDSQDVTPALTDAQPIQFDSNTGIVYAYVKRGTFTIDYNPAGISEDKTITEMGLTYDVGDATNNTLVTHSRVYDEHGQESSFVKHLNEKIFITVYLGIAMNLPTVINTMWNNGNYALINPYYFLTKLCSQNCIGNYYNGCYHYSMYLKMFDRFYHNGHDNSSAFSPFYNGVIDTTQGSITATKHWIDGGAESILYENGWVSKLIMIDSGGDKHGRGGIHCMHVLINHNTSMHLSTPEAIELTAMTNFNDNTFSDALWTYCTNNDRLLHNSKDYRGRLQLDQISVTHMQTYNHLTKLWEDESFLQDSSFIYDHSFMYRIHYQAIFNNVPVVMYIYMNDKAGLYDILSFNTTANHVWATDTYWDPSTWVEVTKSNVESSYNNKRFYLIADNVDLIPTYDYTCLQLNNVNTEYTIDPTGIRRNTNSDYVMELIPNPKCNCLVGLNKVVYPDDPSDVVMYTIENYGNKESRGFVSTQPTSSYSPSEWSLSMFKITDDGDRLVLAHKGRVSYNAADNYCAGCYRIYTISDDKTVAPTFVDVQIPYTSQTYDIETRHSFTDTGYVVSTHNIDQEVGIVDLYAGAGSETYVIPNATYGLALNRTTLCVYRDTTDLSILKFNVYDMATKTITKSFTINGNYLMNGIAGWKNHVYIRVYDQVAQYYTIIYYNIDNDTQTGIEDPISTTSESHVFNTRPSGIWDNAFRSCDECLIIPYFTESNSSLGVQTEFRIILANDPIKIRDLKTELGYTDMYTSGRIMKNTDGSFVGLEFISNRYSDYIGSNYAYNSPVTDSGYSTGLLDIGDLYDNNHLDKALIYTNESNGNRRNAIHTVYKEYDLYYPSDTELKFNPLRRSRIHKIIGTTDTIQCINNPKRVTPTDGFTFKIQRN